MFITLNRKWHTNYPVLSICDHARERALQVPFAAHPLLIAAREVAGGTTHIQWGKWWCARIKWSLEQVLVHACIVLYFVSYSWCGWSVWWHQISAKHHQEQHRYTYPAVSFLRAEGKRRNAKGVRLVMGAVAPSAATLACRSNESQVNCILSAGFVQRWQPIH